MKNIRNFCIIAHIDHWKSTLADRMLEITGVIKKADKWQVLDSMDLEQERWITIKLAPVRMYWERRMSENWKQRISEKDIREYWKNIRELDAENIRKYWENLWEFNTNGKLNLEEEFRRWNPDVYQLNLIDTPWHVDFQYEVSRSLASVEWAILLVDATQWIQAQTLSTLYMALDYDLEIIPVINKIDLPAAQPDKVATEIENLIWVPKNKIIKISAKTWENVPQVLDAVVENIPDPSFAKDKLNITDNIPRALIFDSIYDPYRWVVTYIRSIQWEFKPNTKVYLIHTQKFVNINQTGYFSPSYCESNSIKEWEIGYIITWLKSVQDAKIGDTITFWLKENEQNKKKYAIPWFKKIQPTVYSWVYPLDSDEYEKLKQSLEKLAINDSAITYEYENSKAFGFGFRVGFLGMLHMDIVKERLKREFQVETIFTVPNVVYIVKLKNFTLQKVKTGENITEIVKTGYWKNIVELFTKYEKDRFYVEDNFVLDKKQHIQPINLKEYLLVRSWADMPDLWYIDQIYEPFVNVEIVSNEQFSWNIMQLVQDYRWKLKKMDYIDKDRILWHYSMPLSEIIVDFHDKLKSVSKWYASYSYEFSWYKPEDLVRLDIYINKEILKAFSVIVHKDNAYYRWRDIVKNLKQLIPKHLFPIPLQAVVGSKPIARETIPAIKKDVLAKCYWWDITRKRKLLQKQKEWKKKLKSIWTVNVPTDIFIKMVKK